MTPSGLKTPSYDDNVIPEKKEWSIPLQPGSSHYINIKFICDQYVHNAHLSIINGVISNNNEVLSSHYLRFRVKGDFLICESSIECTGVKLRYEIV